MHVAAAIGTPTIGIFGPTSPWHWAPLNPIAAAVQQTVETLDCQPCHKPTCRLRHHRCMRDISAEQVLEVTQRALAQAPAGLGRNPLHGGAHIGDRRHVAERSRRSRSCPIRAARAAPARCRRRSPPAARRARRRDATARYRRRPRMPHARSSARPRRAAAVRHRCVRHSSGDLHAAPPLGVAAPRQHDREVRACGKRLRQARSSSRPAIPFRAARWRAAARLRARGAPLISAARSSPKSGGPSGA